MTIHAPAIVRQANPGQFVHLRCLDSAEPLLRRPFSFHRLHRHSFELLYKVVGRGTKILAKKRKGETVDILGPLGNGFELKRDKTNKSNAAILVAGGMGVAPLLALAEKLAHKNKIVVLLGARTKNALLAEQDFKRLGAEVRLATDDGSKGRKGLVSDLLNNLLRSIRSTKYEVRCTIYACGPQEMLKAISRLSRRFKIASQGSLEENMACGLGACLGCAVRTKRAYRLVCKDGPVFDLQEIIWQKNPIKKL